MLTKFHLPERMHNVEGEVRRVGFELEFAGIEPTRIAEILVQQLNGEIHHNHHAELLVKTHDFGEFMVELDSLLVKELASKQARWRKRLGAAEQERIARWLTLAAGQLVPAEIVCPPLEISRLHEINGMVGRLREAGALGTDKSLLYAFGLHINPELPDLEARTIINYLKAYCLAQDWLLKAHKVDPVRRITPYIDLYPKRYITRVLSYTRREGLEQIIDDYLECNPTRNRALDLLPLFRHLDETRIDRAIDDKRVKSRPTFHYRMPNCEIEKPHWDLTVGWNIWCVLERLGADEDLLDEITWQWHEYNDSLITLEGPAWFKTLDQIHHDLSSA